MVDDEQQPPGRIGSPIEEGGGEQVSPCRGELSECLVQRVGGQQGRAVGGGGKVAHPVVDAYPAGRTDVEPPLLAGGVEAHPQGRVPVDERLEGGGEAVGGQPGRGADHHVLAERVEVAVLFAPPVDDGGRRERSGVAVGARGGGGRGVHGLGARGEAVDGGRAEEVVHGDAQPGLVGAADELDGGDAVAAGVEEAVVDADRRGVEEFCEEDQEEAFSCGAGCGGVIGPGGAGQGVRAGHRGRFGQGGAVRFAVVGERQCGQDGPLRRDHVVGERLGEVPAQGLRVGLRSVGGDHPGGQPLPVGPFLAHCHEGLGDGGVLDERGGDLVGLDAEAPQFDLSVGASAELQSAVRQPACQVAGPVHAGAGRAVGVGDEAFGGLSGTAEVAARDAGPGEVELPRHPGGHRLEPGVQDVAAAAVQGAADGEAPAARPGGQVGVDDLVPGGAGGRLRRSVAVDDRGVRAVEPDGPDGAGRDDVAAGPHHVEAAQAARVLLGDELEEAGGQPEAGGAGFGEQPPQGPQVEVAGRGDDDLAAVEEGHPEFHGGGVEGVRGVHHHPAGGRGFVTGVGGEGEDALVGEGDALGDAGRSGGEDDAGQLSGYGGTGRGGRGGRRRRGQGLGGVEDDGRACGLFPGRQSGSDDEDGGVRLGDDAGPSGVRRAGVEGDVDAAALEDGKGGDGVQHAALHEDGDAGLPAHPGGGEVGGEPVGPGLQFRVGQRFRVGAQGDGLRGAAGVGGDPLRDAAGGGAGWRGAGGCPAPAVQEPGAFFRGEQVGGADGGVGGVGEPGEESDEAFAQGAGGLRGEQGGAVLQDAVEALAFATGSAALVQAECQVALGGAGGDGRDLGAQPGQVEPLGGRRGEDQHHLEEGRPGLGAVRGQGLHDPFERGVLMGEGVQVGGTDPGEEFTEGGVAGGVGAQDEGVDVEADRCVEPGVGPVGDGGGDGDVRAGAEAGEEDRERGVDDHEQAGAFGGGEPGEASVQCRGDPEGGGGSLVRRRCRPVDGQGDAVRQPVQGAGPVGEAVVLGGGAGAGVRGAVEREVGVLVRQGRQVRGCRASQPRGVRGLQVGGEDAE